MRTKNAEYFSAIEDFIDGYREARGVSPSIYEIAGGIGLSKSTVGRYLSYMRGNDMIEGGGRRNTVTRRSKEDALKTVRVPVLGAVSCGVPKFAQENIEEYVRLPVSIFGEGEFYLLRSDGDSMINAGIDDGDLVLVRHQDYAQEGQIVVALMEEEATLKRYYPEPEKQRVRLQPENDRLEPVFVKDCVIQGVVVKVIKDLG